MVTACIVKISSVESWESCLHILTQSEIEKVYSYVFPKDQLRALVSLLLQKYAILERYGIYSSNIQRTREVRAFHIYILIVK
jgi:hypothetical protein